MDMSEAAKLNLEDITINQRFNELEEKMDLVLNCDLDEEWTKVLDRDLVKLFRLAQLSVSYLLHCQMYLDRCVVLLQDQLTAALQEVSYLKDRTSNFECEICGKTFLSASYLESHQRRRHESRNVQTARISVGVMTDPPEKATVGNSLQQTDSVRCTAVGSQTTPPRLNHVGVMTDPREEEAESKEKLDQLQALAERLEKVEARAMQPQDNAANSMLLLQNLISALPLANFLPVQQPESVPQEQPLIDLRTPDAKAIVQLEKVKPKINHREFADDTDSDTSTNGLFKDHQPIAQERNQLKPRSRRKIMLHSQEDLTEKPPKPRPRSVLSRQPSLFVNDLVELETDEEEKENTTMITPFKELPVEATDEKTQKSSIPKHETQNVDSNPKDSIQNALQINKKSPKENPNEKNSGENNFLLIKSPRQKSSFLKKIVTKNSPKLKGLGKTLRRSWSSLYDSRTPTSNMERQEIVRQEDQEKIHHDLIKKRQERFLARTSGKDEVKSFPPLEEKLREIGVDPEWSGIPEETLARALSALQHRLSSRAKQLPEYRRIRDELEMLVEKKLEEISEGIPDENVEEEISKRVQRNMYDIESDTESEELPPNSKPTAAISSPLANISTSRENTIISQYTEASLHPPPTAEQKKNENTKSAKDQSLVTPFLTDTKKAVKETDFSIFEVARKVDSSLSVLPEDFAASSDSSEPEAIPQSRLKSSLQSKGKDEVKKKVVFADNFELETSYDLTEMNKRDSSTSSSDWDIPMP